MLYSVYGYVQLYSVYRTHPKQRKTPARRINTLRTCDCGNNRTRKCTKLAAQELPNRIQIFISNDRDSVLEKVRLVLERFIGVFCDNFTEYIHTYVLFIYLKQINLHWTYSCKCECHIHPFHYTHVSLFALLWDVIIIQPLKCLLNSEVPGSKLGAHNPSQSESKMQSKMSSPPLKGIVLRSGSNTTACFCPGCFLVVLFFWFSLLCLFLLLLY